ncbi:putative tetratricopeptide-like helical domain superfamily, DYW domain-containing protein [Helianthus annuus]|uniref:Putative pentatricopeptide repeat (PPR) superfamily protein n=1 Tax=Helianthus annuus TaxID=4232 RepID=A0A251SI62_HELAN|nr:pentatricopeptide repeat-containing protein At5g44230 [Helianthus annuus]KAF5768934.1 putative tetratricopeptide-like helical domain superfamily, DYW domain-containing protein [Helianthus annuus]KAJ0485620.1 putative tetratricopeptide-like helical domain superfamily, DYW domain-containing protein [Helianthus annuus]KAJ0656171.1 putative tetratricopeptide-like helical domain superfamily, DYW domain-containing protein [Helianthus annuus]KAJ0840231.1 putative tetratricopeptide-like helical doma
MASISRTLTPTKTHKLQPLQYNNQKSQQTLNPSNPISNSHQTKILESKLVSLLDTSDNLNQAKLIHAHIIRKGLDQCCYVITKLIRVLTAKFNVPVDPYPIRLFQQVKRPNLFLFTALIRGYVMQGSLMESVGMYSLMRRHGIGPISFTFTGLLKGCGGGGGGGLGVQIHGQVVKFGGFESDLYVGNTLIDMYVRCELLGSAHKVFDEMPERDAISWTSLIVAYARQGSMEEAGELFDGMPVKDMVAWTTMVMGFSQNGKPREALECFDRMLEARVETDEVTLASVISACAQLGATKYAKWVQDVADRAGLGATDNIVIGSALINMYAKCGCIEEARNVFDKMKNKNVYSYSSLILGLAMHGCAQEAISLFEKMLKTDIKPNKVTFLGVLGACCHAGLVQQGQNFFAEMEKEYGVTRTVDHYTCMVDLLGRAGLINDAYDIIKTMPMPPHAGVWGALLGACRIHGNPDIAEIAASYLFELEPNAIGNYILLSNTYASARKWNEVSRIRALFRSKGLKKNPASSWVEGEKGVIHEFFAGDMNHPRTSEIKRELEDLVYKLMLDGYTPVLSCVPYDVSDDEKKRILLGHSEKLALAYGLLVDCGIIRIMKNVRICEDCHVVMCGASKISGREIIVRDNTRFHHFCNGVCSCNNFW